MVPKAYHPKPQIRRTPVYSGIQGVSKVATVYINGDSVGEHKGPYTPFSLDITGKLTPGSDNVIAIKVRFPAAKRCSARRSALDYMVFGGIVRDVSLTIVNPLHVEWVFISTPTAGTAAATVRVQTRVRNNSTSAKSCTVLSTIADSANAVTTYVQSSHTVLPDSCYDFCDTTPVITNPRLWHPDHPYLYTVYSQVLCDTGSVDNYTEKLGIRSIVFNKTSGNFLLMVNT